MTQPTDPTVTAPPADPTVTTPPAPPEPPTPPPTAATPAFTTGQFVVLTTGEGDYTRTELAIVTGDLGDADVPAEDGTVEHYYTVERVPQGQPVAASRLAPA